MPKQNAKARALAKARTVAREKGLEPAHPCKGSLGGKQSYESARRKCWRKFQDQQWNRIHWWLNSSWNWKSQLLDIHVDEAGEADPAPSAEPSVDAAPSQHAVLEQSASLPPAGVVEELSEACAPESEQHGAARPLFARADGDAEEPSAVAQRATAVQAQPSIETLPDPMSGPRETGMAQPSSSSGSAPVQGPNPA